MPFLAIVIPVIGITVGTAISIAVTIGTIIFGTIAQQSAKKKAKRKARQAREDFLASLKDRTITEIATEAPHRYIYGEARVGSNVVAMFTAGANDEFRYLVCIHAAHECEEITETWIDGIALGPLDVNGDIIDTNHDFVRQTTSEQITGLGTVTVRGQQSQNYIIETVTITESMVRVRRHLGGPNDHADEELLSVLPDKWKSTAVLRGLCYTVIRLNLLQSEFQNGIPQIEMLIKGRKLYDPRDMSTAWSDNPALIIRDYLTSPMCKVPESEIPDSFYITAANVCDEVQSFRKLYTLNGTVTAEQGQPESLELMANSMAGLVVAVNWQIQAGKYVAPVKIFDETDIVGDITVFPGIADSDLYNGIKGQYVSAENKYVATDFAPFRIPVFRDNDGRDLDSNIDFAFTNTKQRVHNLCRILIEEHRNGHTIRASFSQKAWDLGIGERILFTSTFLGITDKVFIVTDKKYRPTSAIDLTLKEDAESIWDLATTVNADDTPNTDLISPFRIEPLTSLTVESGTAQLLLLDDGTVLPRMKVTWGLSPTAQVIANGQVEIEWREVLDTVWEKVIASGDENEVCACPVKDTRFYVVRGRAVNPTLNVKSDWIFAEIHLVVGKFAPPSDVTNFTINGDVLSLTPVSDLDLAGYLFRFHYGTNTDWSSAITLHLGFVTEIPFKILSLPYGALTLLAKAIDTSGNESVNAVAIAHDQGAVPIANIIESKNEHTTFPGTKDMCAVVADELVADGVDSFYGDPSASFYGAGGESFYGSASGFTRMVYTTLSWTPASVLVGSNITLAIVTEGDNVTIEYKATIGGVWLNWPGLIVAEDTGYQFRVTIGSGETRGKIITMSINIDAQDLTELVPGIASTVAAKNIPYTKSFANILLIGVALHKNATNGETVEIDTTTNLTPKFNVFDSSHTAVANADVDFYIQGY